jgi:hypothetical protein
VIIIREDPASRRAGAPKHRQRFLSVRPGGWCRTPVNSSGTGVIRVCTLYSPADRAAQGAIPPGQPPPPPHPPLQSASKGIGGARGLAI